MKIYTDAVVNKYRSAWMFTALDEKGNEVGSFSSPKEGLTYNALKILAMVEALAYASTLEDKTSVSIFSDSQYAIWAFESTRRPKANKEVVQKARKDLDAATRAGLQVEFIWESHKD